MQQQQEDKNAEHEVAVEKEVVQSPSPMEARKNKKSDGSINQTQTQSQSPSPQQTLDTHPSTTESTTSTMNLKSSRENVLGDQEKVESYRRIDWNTAGNNDAVVGDRVEFERSDLGALLTLTHHLTPATLVSFIIHCEANNVPNFQQLLCSGVKSRTLAQQDVITNMLIIKYLQLDQYEMALTWYARRQIDLNLQPTLQTNMSFIRYHESSLEDTKVREALIQFWRGKHHSQAAQESTSSLDELWSEVALIDCGIRSTTPRIRTEREIILDHICRSNDVEGISIHLRRNMDVLPKSTLLLRALLAMRGDTTAGRRPKPTTVHFDLFGLMPIQWRVMLIDQAQLDHMLATMDISSLLDAVKPIYNVVRYMKSFGNHILATLLADKNAPTDVVMAQVNAMAWDNVPIDRALMGPLSDFIFNSHSINRLGRKTLEHITTNHNQSNKNKESITCLELYRMIATSPLIDLTKCKSILNNLKLKRGCNDYGVLLLGIQFFYYSLKNTEMAQIPTKQLISSIFSTLCQFLQIEYNQRPSERLMSVWLDYWSSRGQGPVTSYNLRTYHLLSAKGITDEHLLLSKMQCTTRGDIKLDDFCGFTPMDNADGFTLSAIVQEAIISLDDLKLDQDPAAESTRLYNHRNQAFGQPSTSSVLIQSFINEVINQ
ncbi:hypothetical protein SAMD00019534_103570 [Acytostelium subglobosum LB1]|uniref:hypothetical protein n=1 Tax=Acytostelium subglobosum LB1 TaxID=1410327 RepID=UPI0006452112|nr:hypothetical protein SAMD00019534_103570 [Acytostelium subglobosum LB1]GAM27182.1 hypothetical protein SAMD00019534_103570 [Acytostelium subglobosum LB1]|eukprot:XP_012750062.1 hypothetical protein SAMD00019534_103570 [Acytostelium subglobosum LB1]